MIKFSLNFLKTLCSVLNPTDSQCLSLNVCFLLLQKLCYLLKDFSAFIFHFNVHILSSPFWHSMYHCYYLLEEVEFHAVQKGL